MVKGLFFVTLPRASPPIIAVPIGLVDPPTLTMLVDSKESDNADETAPGCLAGGGDPSPFAVEADPPGTDIV